MATFEETKVVERVVDGYMMIGTKKITVDHAVWPANIFRPHQFRERTQNREKVRQ